MKKRVVPLVLILTITVFLFHFLFVWVNANADSYFYWMIGDYFRTGVYPFTSPFIYTRPTTISPPLYGLFFVFTHGMARADILLHALQLMLLGTTSILLYRTLRIHVTKSAALIISCAFALIPLNLIYASYVLTENPSQFFVILWTYLVVDGIRKKQPFALSVAILVGAIAGLMKYNLMIFMILAGIFLLPFFKKMKWTDYVFPIVAFIIVSSWIFANYRITGTWGLYDTHGTQLYNQFVAQTKLLPPKNHPAVLRMKSLLPPGTDIAVPYWDIQEHLGQSLHGVWHDIDTVLFDVAWASVQTHPFAYLVHSIQNFARMHYDNLPHWSNLGNMGRTDLFSTNVPYCSRLDAVQMCAPIIMTPWSYHVWNTFIKIELLVFRIASPLIFYFLLLPAICISILWGDRFSRIYTAIYLAGVIPIAFTIHVDPRYVLPFYPIALLIIVTSGQIFIKKVQAIANRRH